MATTIKVGYSEAACFLGVAGKEMFADIGGRSVQLLDDDLKPYSFPITAGEAGYPINGDNVGGAFVHTQFDERSYRLFRRFNIRMSELQFYPDGSFHIFWGRGQIRQSKSSSWGYQYRYATLGCVLQDGTWKPLYTFRRSF